MKKQISAVLVASVIATNTSPVINVFADEVITEKSKILEKRTINQAKVTQFNIINNKNFESYNEKFRVLRDEIKSISNNGGRYNSSTILDNAIDGNMSTHWETGKANSADFKNEVVVEFNDIQSIDRIAYATRQDGSKGKGFPTQFEIYSSITGNDEDFELVSTGEHSATGNMMEFKFDTITTKKVKFVFKEAHQGWASASEFWFYKEDKIIDKLNTLFTDSNMNVVSEEFNTIDKLNQLEKEAKEHPLYEDFKENIENAKILISKDKVEATTASTKQFEHYGNEKYSELFKMSLSNIKSIKNNGGHWASQAINNAVDGKLDTYWETNRLNSSSFNNEVEVEFKDTVTLNRVVYGARPSDRKGFAEEFEIYGSKTSKGDTYELVATGKHNTVSGLVEAKFESNEFKRIKFKFKKSNQNSATLSELAFYSVDEIDDKMDRLFTDSSMSKVSDEFNSLDKIEALEKEASTHPLASTYKEDIENAKILISKDKVEATTALTSKFEHYNNEKYSELFRMPLSNIKSIKNNAGNWGSQAIKNAIDGNLNTYWETNTTNTDTFKNEVEVEFKDVVTLNRVVYGARPSDRKGFAQEFEIYGSKTSKGDTYELVATGKHNTTTGQVEAKFNPTEFKRLKFKFVKADANWPTLNEISFYKEDEIADKMDRLFTDSSMSKVSDEFNSLDKIEALEKEASTHPLASTYKEDIENAKILITQNKIESSIASTKKVDYYENEKYSELFRMPLSNINSIKNNGGNWGSQVIKNAVDGNLGTYWETKKTNTDTFKNEVEVEFKDVVTLNRVVYGARQSDRKGFAQEFEIYGSKTSKGDTYELVATGKHDKTTGQVEAKFNPTEFKRLKFKFVKSDQNWATLNEISFYKQDEIYEKVNSIFTGKLMDELKDEFNSKEAIDALAKEVESHPLKVELDHLIERAYKIINNDMSSSSVKMTLPQFGDVHGHAKKDLLMSSFGTNLISTGLVATPGEVFEVYVDAKEGQPMPKIAFTQSQGHYGKWKREFSLNPGYNKITVPNIYDSNWSHKTNPGGAVYIVNPYTAEEQGKAPVVSVEGGRKFPMYNEGDDVNKFLEELKEYKKFMDENPDTAVNIVEYNSPRIMHTGLADAAYKVYVEEGVNVEESIRVWSDITQKMFDFAGLEDNPKVKEHDSTNLRTTIRVMQPFGAAYAAGDHIGIQNHVADDFLRTDKNSINGIIWGTVHEIGHQMDIRPRTWGEITNNMWSNRMAIDNGKADGARYVGIYNNGATDKENVAGFYNFGYSDQLAMFWQLEAYHTGYWTSLERMYRERKPSPKNEEEKRDILAKYSSEILDKDLTEYFTRYKFDLSEECKKELAKFEKTTDKIWYGNTTVQTYEGSGFTEDLELQVDTVINKEKRTVTLNMSVDKENEDDKLGYEILKDGKVIGYTTDNKFVIENANVDSNEIYQVKAYDRNFGSSDALDVNTFKPTIKTMDKVTLKLGEEFNAKDYAKAFSYDDEILDSVEIKHNVNTNEKGIYTVNYSITDEGIKVSKDMTVEVVSDYDYLSDEEWKSVETQWGTPRRNSNIKGRVNGDIKEFEKGFGIHANGKITYDLSNKEYDKFEALLGVDTSIAAQTKSSITFKIVGDGKTLATTNVLKHADDMVYVNVDVKGVKELVIEIHDGGNGNASDHGVIANPKLTTNNAKAKITAEEVTYVKAGSDFDLMDGVSASDKEDGNLTSNVKVDSEKFNINRGGEYTITYSVTDSDNNVTTKERKVIVYNDNSYLTDLDWESAVSGWKSVNKDSAVNTKNKIKLNVNGEIKEFDRGIGAATNAEIVYNLDGNYNYFTTYVGTDKNYDHNSTTIRFKIFADGKEVYTSDVIRKNSEAEFVNLNVAGVKELKLVADDVDNNGLGDFASWGDSKLYSIDKLYTMDLEKAIEEAEKLDLNNYSDETIIVLEKALANAKEALKSGNQELIDSSTEELKGAMDSLVEANLDKVVNIPDEYLVKSIQAQLNKTGDITLGDMRSLTTLTLSGVERLDGIEYAINLETLSMEYNEVKDLRPLANLKKLNNLNASQQFIPGGGLVSSNGKVVAESKAYNREGKNVAKTVRLVDKFGATIIEKEAEDEFVIDTTELKEGSYGVHVLFEDEGFDGMIMYMLDVK